MAQFFTDEIGFASFNIEKRLAEFVLDTRAATGF